MRKAWLKLVGALLVLSSLVYVSLWGAEVGAGGKIFGLLTPNGIKQGLDLKGGSVVVYRAQKEQIPTKNEMDIAKAMIRGRLDAKGYTEATVQGQDRDKLRVEIPSISDPKEAEKELGRTGKLTFRDYDGAVILDGAEVESAASEYSVDDSYYVSLKFKQGGAEKFKEATARIKGLTGGKNYISIFLDEDLISSARVTTVIDGGYCKITGSFSSKDTKYLADVVKAGQLPFALEPVECRSIGATLGEKAMETSVRAGAIGICLVMIFVLLFYRLPGIAANIALVAYVAIMAIILANAHVNVTLPGIAGIILSIGMAIDANVIIFERIREELRNGKTVRAACELGFKRSLAAIGDSNITTIVSGLILWKFGAGFVKGFGFTLMIGVIMSMLSALFITKFLLKLLVDFGIKGRWIWGAGADNGGKA